MVENRQHDPIKKQMVAVAVKSTEKVAANSEIAAIK